MQPSSFMTYTVPGPFPAAEPIVVAQGPRASAVRAAVRNLGGGTVFFAWAPGDVIGAGGPSMRTFRLPAGEVEVFVLAPMQKLYAVADAGNVMVSVSVSEALPLL